MTPVFWFVMVGFVIAYPINWWLVANHLKHGMMTVRPAGMFGTMQDHAADAGARPPVLVVALLSFAALAAGLATASLFGGPK